MGRLCSRVILPRYHEEHARRALYLVLLSHRTPPVMTLGVRDSAEFAVRAGMKYIEFAERPEADAVAIGAYLRSLVPVASPRLENGALSAAAAKGQAVFDRAGCADCHPHGLYTNQK